MPPISAPPPTALVSTVQGNPGDGLLVPAATPSAAQGSPFAFLLLPTAVPSALPVAPGEAPAEPGWAGWAGLGLPIDPAAASEDPELLALLGALLPVGPAQSKPVEQPEAAAPALWQGGLTPQAMPFLPAEAIAPPAAALWAAPPEAPSPTAAPVTTPASASTAAPSADLPLASLLLDGQAAASPTTTADPRMPTSPASATLLANAVAVSMPPVLAVTEHPIATMPVHSDAKPEPPQSLTPLPAALPSATTDPLQPTTVLTSSEPVQPLARPLVGATPLRPARSAPTVETSQDPQGVPITDSPTPAGALTELPTAPPGTAPQMMVPPAESAVSPATPAATLVAKPMRNSDGPRPEPAGLASAEGPSAALTGSEDQPLAPQPLGATSQRSEPFSLPRSEPVVRSEPNPVERAVAHQVSRAIIQHLPDGGARMVMRLTPPELGTVRIEFLMRDGTVTARLLAEDDGVRQALDRALPQLRNEVRTEHPTVDITVDRSDQRQSWQDGNPRHEQRHDPQGGQGRPRESDEHFTLDEAAPLHEAAPRRIDPVLGGRVSARAVDAFA